MVVMKEETRKGPWTEQEDLQLVCFVTLYGERRWDFIAKVSGLNRTGKSCRLRWVNYLHPGLKRGRMTPQEERLVLELHCRWGNRWSRIARRLPGRTDNEIKNYWRTHMRKKAQERKMNFSSSSLSLSPSSTSSSSSSSSSSCLLDDEPQQVAITVEKADESHGGAGDGGDLVTTTTEEGYPMDQIWKEIIGSSEARTGLTGHEELYKDEVCRLDCAPLPPPSPPWEYTSDSLWKTYDEEFKMCLPVGDFLVCNYHQQQGREYY